MPLLRRLTMGSVPLGRGATPIVLLTALIALGIAALAALQLWHDRARTIAEGERTAANLAQVLAEQTTRTVQAVDLTLRGLVTVLELAPYTEPYDPQFHALLRSRLRELPYLRALFVIGPDGYIIHDTDTDTPRVSLADREYFQVHREDPNLGLFIGPPLISRSKWIWFVSMSRRLTAPGGGFGGVAVAAVEPRYFQRFYGTIDVGEHGSITLLRKDGLLVARAPNTPHLTGRSFADLELFRERLPRAPTGTFLGTSPVDGRARIVSYRELPGTPFIVVAAIDQETLLAEWRQRAFIVAAGVALVALLLALVAYFVLQHRQRRAAIAWRAAQTQRLEALGRMTGGVAHDFNNVVQACRSGLTLIRSRAGDAKTLPPIIDATDKAVEHGAQLVRQLLAFARRQDLNPEVLDLNQLIDDARNLLRYAGGSNTRIQLELEEGLWPVRVDPTQLQSALMNLVTNARDAMPAGGTITVKTANLAAAAADGVPLEFGRRDLVLLTVADAGRGMRPETLARAMEPFFTTKPEDQGTGLGLSQIYGFVSQSGGQFDLQSEVGRGTTATIALPRAEPAAAA